MDKIEIEDTLSQSWAKVQFLKEVLTLTEAESALSERARFGLQQFFNNIQVDIETVLKEVDPANHEPSIQEEIEHARRRGNV